MNKKHNTLLLRIPDPFDNSARTRLMRMGVLDKDGQLDSETMKVFAGIFAGSFFDDLIDYYDNFSDLLTIYKTFRELYGKQDTQHMFLLLSIQYDYIRKPLPDPVWWLAGDNIAVRAFMTEFIRRLESFIAESELEEDAEK